MSAPHQPIAPHLTLTLTPTPTLTLTLTLTLTTDRMHVLSLVCARRSA